MYSKLNINGNCDINYVWSKENLSETDITMLKNAGIHTPVWSFDTNILATFNSNLLASDVNFRKDIKGYYVYRRDMSEQKKYLVAKLSNTDMKIFDFNIGNTLLYKYYIVPIYGNDKTFVLGKEIETDIINTEFDTLSIIGLTPTEYDNTYKVEEKDIWTFSLNTSLDDFKPQYNKKTFNTTGKFPKIYSDDTSYLTVSGSVLLGNIACNDVDYIGDDIKKIQKWIDFCNNGQIKLLRDIKGHVIPCDIIDTSYKYSNNILQMPTTISFTITQIDDSKNLSIYRLDGV